jgi:hypothetical protein
MCIAAWAAADCQHGCAVATTTKRLATLRTQNLGPALPFPSGKVTKSYVRSDVGVEAHCLNGDCFSETVRSLFEGWFSAIYIHVKLV